MLVLNRKKCVKCVLSERKTKTNTNNRKNKWSMKWKMNISKTFIERRSLSLGGCLELDSQRCLNQFGQRRLNCFKCFADRLFFPVGHSLTDVYLLYLRRYRKILFTHSLTLCLLAQPFCFCFFFGLLVCAFRSSRWCVKIRKHIYRSIAIFILPILFLTIEDWSTPFVYTPDFTKFLADRSIDLKMSRTRTLNTLLNSLFKNNSQSQTNERKRNMRM